MPTPHLTSRQLLAQGMARQAAAVMRDLEEEMYQSLVFVQVVDEAAREAFLRCTPEEQFRVRTKG